MLEPWYTILMNSLQTKVVFIYGIIALLVFVKGLYKSTKEKNPYRETRYLSWMGIFVWGDAVVFGLFWFLSSLISYLLKDWLLFLLIISVFWIVRSLGETIYCFNQQFSNINRNPPERLRGYQFFKNDSIWFVYQISWQCVNGCMAVATIYLANLWLKNNF